MKNKLIAIFTFSILFVGCESMFDANNPQPKHQKVSYPTPFEFSLIDSCNGNKNELYVKAYEWIAKTFTSAKDVIQMNDKESGKIIAKAVTAIDGAKNMYGVIGQDYIHYTISIDVKENKYRCTITDFYHEGGVYGGQQCSGGSLENKSSLCKTWYMTMKRWISIKNDAVSDAENTLSSLKKYMRTKAKDF